MLSLLMACNLRSDTAQDTESCPPQAAFTVSCSSEECTSLTFDGSGSTGEIATFEWDFGDGETAEGDVVSHAFVDGAAVHTVTLTLTGIDGQLASFSETATDLNAYCYGETSPDQPIVYASTSATYNPLLGACRVSIQSVGGCFSKPIRVDWTDSLSSSPVTIMEDFVLSSNGYNLLLQNPYLNKSYLTDSLSNTKDKERKIVWSIDDGASGKAEVMKPDWIQGSTQPLCSFQFSCSSPTPIISEFNPGESELRTSRYYLDRDGDGYGDPETWIDAHDSPEDLLGEAVGFVENADDCDDRNSTLSRDCSE